MKKSDYQLLEAYMMSCMQDSAHDKEHIYRVLYMAFDIAEHERGVDYDVLIAACLLHDIGRQEQYDNPAVSHAEAGAGKAYNYEECFLKDCHTAYLVYDGERVVGTGGISFYQVMPTYHNPSGWKAYVMNMYTHPDYRRRKAAFKMLGLLVEEARSRGISFIALEATDMGRPLYEKFGFIPMEHEMELPPQGEKVL